ncbi:transcriptional regulator, AraC family [Arcobacter venerupis]|uniref:Transcriptional regulator, AraC family n=1 Tax=Arcobacter venerupis TaxID=1054033 RepID=A0AAE7B944_9BACT|nr:AraC family transcriptional regulator [Arcobacter venerupis]QKF66062.1 transcriptional regulator, AraC family [Arcobacter venerupis]RWS51149.1 AraC family transcriptional regulator [Arcobacter venerupis]
MSYNFTLDNMSEFMCSSKVKKEFNLIFPDKIGSMSCEKEIINEDIFLFKTHAKTKQNIEIQANSKVDSLIISILLDGKIKYKDLPYEKVETYIKNDTYIKYIDEYDSTTILDKDCNSKGIAISIKNNFLEKYLYSHFSVIEELKNQKSNKLSSTLIHKIDNQKNIKLAQELYNSPFHGNLHDIYLQSKCLEIIYNELNELISPTKYNSDEKIKLSEQDIEALYKARDIILLTHEFPDLTTLSRKIALNEFKLKFGFKQLFNTTPGNMILEHKMIHAKQLLETSEFSISEISNFVGYKHQQSFTNAFIQFFGIRPKDVMKSRKYYY